jgi:hypothetical protein
MTQAGSNYETPGQKTPISVHKDKDLAPIRVGEVILGGQRCGGHTDLDAEKVLGGTGKQYLLAE